MNKLLHKLLYENEISLHAEYSGSELVWVLQSIRKKEDFCCAFKVDEDLNQRETIDFYVQPAIVSLENMRNVNITDHQQLKGINNG